MTVCRVCYTAVWRLCNSGDLGVRCVYVGHGENRRNLGVVEFGMLVAVYRGQPG